MLGLLKKLFGPLPPADRLVVDSPKPPSPYKGYTVEFYPETSKYFALFKGRYLKRHFQTGIVEEMSYASMIIYAEQFKTEEEAWKLVDLHREQRQKHNVKVLTR